MKKSIFTSILSCLMLLLGACSSQPSLQKYFIEKMEDPAFLVVNLPINLQELFSEELNQEETAILQSINKLNLLFFNTQGKDAERYQTEIGQLSQILEGDHFEELISFRAFESNGSVLFEGSSSDIDEGIIWLQSPKFGFGIIRILGNKMNPLALMTLIKKIDKEKLTTKGAEQLAPFMDTLKGLKEEAEKEV